jgi:hypothetical protein
MDPAVCSQDGWCSSCSEQLYKDILNPLSVSVSGLLYLDYHTLQVPDLSSSIVITLSNSVHPFQNPAT